MGTSASLGAVLVGTGFLVWRARMLHEWSGTTPTAPPPQLPLPRLIPLPSADYLYVLGEKISVAVIGKYHSIVAKYYRAYGLPSQDMVYSVIWVESKGDPNMVGSAGERGLMQVMPETAREVGVDPSVLHVPEYGILAGTRYLGKMFALFRNLVDTFSAYNGGPDAPYKKTREGLYLNQQYVDKNLIALHAIQYYRGGIMSA